MTDLRDWNEHGFLPVNLFSYWDEVTDNGLRLSELCVREMMVALHHEVHPQEDIGYLGNTSHSIAQKVIAQDPRVYLLWLLLNENKSHRLWIKPTRGCYGVSSSSGESLLVDLETCKNKEQIASPRIRVCMTKETVLGISGLPFCGDHWCETNGLGVTGIVSKPSVSILQRHYKDAAFALVKVQYEMENKVQVCRGDHLDIHVEGRTPIGNSILGQLSWDCLEVRAYLHFLLFADKIAVQEELKSTVRKLHEVASSRYNDARNVERCAFEESSGYRKFGF